MSAKYTRLPTEDVESTTIDFGSAFTYTKQQFPKYFSYSKNEKMYKSIFRYSGNKPDGTIPGDYGVRELSLFERICAGFITVVCYLLVLVTFPCSWWLAFRVVPETERLVIYRLGRVLRVKGTGPTIILPCLDRVTKVDMKTRAFSVPPQKVITSDGAVLEVGADIFFSVKDPILSVSSVQDLNHSMRIIAVASLQKHLSKCRLKHMDSDKTGVVSLLHTDMNQMAISWGVEVSKIELSQIKVLEEANPIVAAASGAGTESALAFLGQIFGSSAGVHMPVAGLPPFASVPPSQSSVQEGAASDPDFRNTKPKITPRYLVTIAKKMINYDLVQQHGTVVQFNVLGDDGGTFYLDLKNEEGSAGEGDPGDIADVTITLTLDDMNSLFTGEMSAFNAYMGGRLQVDGDLKAAMGLQDFVNRIQAQMGLTV